MKYELHGTMNDDANAFYTTIDAGLWLLSRSEKINEVEIILHPLFIEVVTPLFFFGRLLSKDWLDLIPHLKFTLAAVRPGVSKQSGDSARSVFNCVASGETILLSTSRGTLRVKQAPISSLHRLKYFSPQFYLRTLRRFRYLHDGLKLSVDRFLTFSLDGVVIGDLVAAHALRSEQRAGGSIKRLKNLWQYFYRGCALIRYAEDYALGNPTGQNVFVYTNEVTYLHGIYMRFFRCRGASSLERFDPKLSFRLVGPSEEVVSPKIVTARLTAEQLEIEQEQTAIKYMEERIKDPSSRLVYMIHGSNSTHHSVRLESGVEAIFTRDKIDVVIFMHSLSDGQYSYGYDGFEDIADWAIFTIQTIIADNSLGNVYVKLHPNTPSEKVPADDAFKRRVLRLFGSTNRCSFLDSSVSPKALASQGRFLGITHHGSVSEELVFLGIPTIGSRFARWGYCYNFVLAWSSIEEYRLMLRTLPQIYDEWDQKYRVAELLTFLVDYRINAVSQFENAPWLRAARAIGENYIYNIDNYPIGERALRDLPVDSNILQSILEEMIEAHALEKTFDFRRKYVGP